MGMERPSHAATKCVWAPGVCLIGFLGVLLMSEPDVENTETLPDVGEGRFPVHICREFL